MIIYRSADTEKKPGICQTVWPRLVRSRELLGCSCACMCIRSLIIHATSDLVASKARAQAWVHHVGETSGIYATNCKLKIQAALIR